MFLCWTAIFTFLNLHCFVFFTRAFSVPKFHPDFPKKIDDGKQQSMSKRKKAIFPFREARKIARGHGFDSKEEFLEYSCPGAYQLPKNPDEVWSIEWKGWDDFLGVCYGFSEGREIARGLKVFSREEYLELFEKRKIDDDEPASRLPFRPDLKYKADWKGWEDFLGVHYCKKKLLDVQPHSMLYNDANEMIE